MGLQKEIEKRQNEEKMLKCQFAARYYFNAAELWRRCGFWCSFLSVLMFLVPWVDGVSAERAAIILPCVLDGLLAVSILAVNNNVRKGALLRNYFDRVVFGFSVDRYDTREISELVQRAVSHKPKKCGLQILHTSEDRLPGVRNWYKFSQKYSDHEVIFECQKQNQWWTKRMVLMKITVYLLLFLAVIIAGIAVVCLLQINLFRVLACLLGLIIAFGDGLVNEVKGLLALVEIKGCIEALNISHSRKQIEMLQRKIEERRKLPVLEINFVHRLRSRKLSMRYDEISNGEY